MIFKTLLTSAAVSLAVASYAQAAVQDGTFEGLSLIHISFSAEVEDIDWAKANPEKAASPEIPEIRIDRLSISAS